MRFYGQGVIPVDKFLYQTYFKDIENGTFMECGACDGILESSCKFFEEFMGWYGINIEPAKFLYNRLVKNRPYSKNLNLALSNRNGKAKFTHVIHPKLGENFGNGSLKHIPRHYNNLKKIGCKFKEYEVQTFTFKNIIKLLKLKRLDLFVLDVEGHETEVVKGMRSCEVLPKVFCVEFTLADKSLDSMIKELGYTFDKKLYNNAYYLI